MRTPNASPSLSKLTTSTIIGTATLLLSLTSQAALIQVASSSLTATNIVDFEDLGLLPDELVSYDGVLESGLTSFSERFAGQTVVEVGGLDTLIGTPTDELSLSNGVAGENLTTGNLGGNSGLSGESSVMSLGEGSVAVLFDFDQSQIAFDVLGSDVDSEGIGGNVIASFWARDGSLLNQFTLALDGSAVLSFGFINDDGAFNIAGLSLVNDDISGVGYDNFIYDVVGIEGTPGQNSQVPIPSALLLFVSALSGLYFSKRRRIK